VTVATPTVLASAGLAATAPVAVRCVELDWMTKPPANETVLSEAVAEHVAAPGKTMAA